MASKKSVQMLVSEEPVPDSTIIWRYSKFERFRSILETHSLWFSRPFVFEDQWEGQFPPSYLRGTRQYAKDSGISFDEFEPELRNRLLLHRYAHFVSCWHISDHESEAMWKFYAPAGSAIAIQSQVGDVKECLRPHSSGAVIYYDPSHDILCQSIFGPRDILFKRSQFAWEREYRFWFDDDELIGRIEAGQEFREEHLSRGQRVDISDMQRLIHKIVVAPGASDVSIKSVENACAKHGKPWLWNVIERSTADRTWASFTS